MRLRIAPLLLLGATVAAAVPIGLALEADRAGRRHRAAAGRALGDHAEFAALGFRQRLVGALYPAVAALFDTLGNARAAGPAGPIPPPSVLRDAERRTAGCDECGPAPTPAWYFRLTYPDLAVSFDGTPPHGGADWIRNELADLGELRDSRAWEHASLVDTLGVEPVIVILTPRRGPDGTPVAVYGFGVTLGSLRDDVIAPILARGTMLPVPRPVAGPDDSLLSVRIETPDGGRSLGVLGPPRPDGFVARIPGGMYLGGWWIAVALDPVRAPPLLIGELPAPRRTLLLALALVTTVMIAAIAWFATRAAALARARSDFVAGVSHELRTPLAQVLLFAETLSLGRIGSPGEVRQAGGIIAAEARRLIRLIDNVLALGRSSHPAPAAVDRSIIPVAPLVAEVAEGFARAAPGDGTRIVTRLDDRLAAPLDAALVRQMLINLIDNAVKYGPPGQTVTVSVEASPGDHVRIAVTDEGPGIPPAERHRVFEPFVRLERDVASQTAGSGIGLAVVRDIATRHGGAVTVDRAPSAGTAVIVELPGARVVAAEVRCAS